MESAVLLFEGTLTGGRVAGLGRRVPRPEQCVLCSFLVVWMGWCTGSGDHDAVLEALPQVLDAFLELQEEPDLGCLAGQQQPGLPAAVDNFSGHGKQSVAPALHVPAPCLMTGG